MSATHPMFSPLTGSQIPLHLASRPSGQFMIFNFDQFIREHTPRLTAVARRILRDGELARDAVQDAFISIFSHIHEFRGESSLTTWMTRIVVNVSLGYLRRQRSRGGDHASLETLTPSQTPCHSSELPDSYTSRRQQRTMMQQALRQLKPSHQEVIIRHDLQDEPIEQIADDLGVPQGTVKSRLFYGRRALRQVMETGCN